MKSKKKFYIIIAGMILFMLLYKRYADLPNNDGAKEYLQIIALNNRNGADESDGINVCLYEYSIEAKEINQIVEIPVQSHLCRCTL